MEDLDVQPVAVKRCGREWILFRPKNLEDLWESMTDEEFTEDERLPYWVELWPASLALADFLKAGQDRIRGKTCLDLGCGLGLTALVGTWLGAHVIAADYEPKAFPYARRNALVNNVPEPLWVVMDWRRPAVLPASLDFVWGGDIMYEKRFVEPVMTFLEYALKPGGTAWLAEPGRNVYDFFKARLAASGWASRCVLKESVEPLHIQASRVNVNLWELVRGRPEQPS